MQDRLSSRVHPPFPASSSSSSSSAVSATPQQQQQQQQPPPQQLEHAVAVEQLLSQPFPPNIPPHAVLASNLYLKANALAECRICHEEEDVANLENPCACSGSVKYAHRKCVQRWCNEKGDTICEICQEPFKSGYTTSPVQLLSNDISIDFSSDDWNTDTIELDDPRLFAMAAVQGHFLDAQYEEANSSSAACCRSAALILMALLLLRHGIAMAAASVDEDASIFFTLFVLRAVGFLLPCYIMARAMNMLQKSRHRQEAAMAAAEVTMILQVGQARGMHLSLRGGQTQLTMPDLP